MCARGVPIMQPAIDGRPRPAPPNQSCRLKTRGKDLFRECAYRMAPRAPGCGPICGFGANDGGCRARGLPISVTPEDQICRTLCWISDRRGRACIAVRLPQVAGTAACAASFLKHKLWRISNTTPRTSCLALCRAAQVIDRSVICVLGFALARLLLVGT